MQSKEAMAVKVFDDLKATYRHFNLRLIVTFTSFEIRNDVGGTLVYQMESIEAVTAYAAALGHIQNGKFKLCL